MLYQMEQVLLYGASGLILRIEMVDTRQYSWLLDASTLIVQTNQSVNTVGIYTCKYLHAGPAL